LDTLGDSKQIIIVFILISLKLNIQLILHLLLKPRAFKSNSLVRLRSIGAILSNYYPGATSSRQVIQA